MYIIAICLIILVIVNIWRMQKKRLHLPPGPCPLPLLGNALQGSSELYKSYHKFSKQYGPVFTVWLGNLPVVALCGYEVVKDAFVNHALQFGDRGPMKILEILSKGYGIATTNGERWQLMRFFTVTTLRNFGMGKRSMEERIQEEARHLTEAVAGKGGQLFNPHILIGRSVNNVINLVVFGRRWNYEDARILKLFSTINNLLIFIRCNYGMAYSVLPAIMKYLPGPHQKVFQDCEELESFIQDQVISHESTLDPDYPRDYIDCFLIKAKKENGNPESHYCQKNLVRAVFELFIAGTDTVSTTIQFAMLVMINYPQIQEQVQKEIDTVVGPYRLTGVADKVKMPYTNAVVHEIQRIANVTPMALPHKVTEDTSFRGFIIPKGITILPIIGSVLSDPEHWETPDEFNPGHFLDQNGDFKLPNAFMPFSAGKRKCPGESLARMELFLFLTALLQKFKFQAEHHPKSSDLGMLRSALRTTKFLHNLRAYPRTSV
ncbi:cytochrome P450 2A13-like [Discoglossus pictus]